MEAFLTRVARAEARADYQPPAAFAVGIATYGTARAEAEGGARRVLDAYYPAPNLAEGLRAAALLAEAVGHRSGSATYPLDLPQIEELLSTFEPVPQAAPGPHPNIRALKAGRGVLQQAQPTDGRATAAVVTFIADLAEKAVDAHDMYLRLHLLSHRKVRPHGLNLAGAFGLLSNVVWTNLGPFEPEDFEFQRADLRAAGHEVRVHSIDRFPRMTDYVVPTGVRIADADRVRLGAHLAEGTTVMHEGFVNYNAGTLGTSMVEGRISAGVVVGNGTDVGGGASIMGTLSGGGKEVIRVGERCLIGANAGIGISLADDCTVEAGLYVTAGTRVALPDGRVVKAAELSGQPGLLFRRNSQTGAVEVLAKKNRVVLNEALHSSQ
ncbi:MAG: tetrahydrodipicolinate N-succinyltransferase N-terminal domain-containing protein [Chloroflexi bacterium]|nr:tetrahydrodipicolinate N-succinyltransferase N-terminal domain-containing protein [Chloroflexota bacterium]